MTIKEAAGKILLLFYSLQNENPVALRDEMISVHTSEKPVFIENTPLVKSLHAITKDDAKLYNAMNYLLNKNLIKIHSDNTMDSADILRGIQLTDIGIDIVEGINQGDEPKKRFGALFNITIKNNVTVDSLVKTEVGNIVGVGGAIGGKVSF